MDLLHNILIIIRYNNQWMIVDYNLFQPGEALPSSDLLWILEQLPLVSDVTLVWYTFLNHNNTGDT